MGFSRRSIGLIVVGVAAAVLAAAATTHGALTGEQRQRILEEAAASYDRGMSQRSRDPGAAQEAFRESARRYQQIIDDGVRSGAVHYNLGNARLQAGELGAAIFQYRWAQTLMPGEARLVQNLAHNLAYARSLRRNQIEPSGERALLEAVTGWHHRTPFVLRFVIFAVAWCVAWCLLIVRVIRSATSSGGTLLAGAAAAGAIALIAGTSVAFDLFTDEDRRIGVVLADDVVVRKGDGDAYQPQFEEPLHQGVEFEVRSRRGGWLEIELPNRKTGWIPSDRAGIVGDDVPRME